MGADRDIVAESIGEALIYDAVTKLAGDRLGVCAHGFVRRCQSMGVAVRALGVVIFLCPRHLAAIGGAR